jgi:UDP-N-acetylmuramoyl-L-alanyl-D-glutamate--2,6-diaminopimelate ligase
MQKIDNHLIWIDYAHTPDAIENAICTLQQHYPTHDIRVVFGCGCKVTKKPCSVGRISLKSSKPKSIISLPLAATKKSA